MIYNRQFGFRNNHSTTHALIDITEKIRSALDKGIFACGVYIDLQKAFDTVNHSILMDKLEYYGIRGVPKMWLESFLIGRHQFTHIKDKSSTKLPVTHGVPQGSVLGPLLFLLYINDLHKAIQHSSVHHFADDTNLLYTNNSLKKINKHINHDIKHLCQWLRSNKISQPILVKKIYDIYTFQIFKKSAIFHNILNIRRLCLECIRHFQRATSRGYIISTGHRKLAS